MLIPYLALIIFLSNLFTISLGDSDALGIQTRLKNPQPSTVPLLTTDRDRQFQNLKDGFHIRGRDWFAKRTPLPVGKGQKTGGNTGPSASGQSSAKPRCSCRSPRKSKRGFDEPTNPKDQTSMDEFVRSEIRKADIAVPTGGTGWKPFRTRKVTMTTDDLCGCTTILLISQNGAWIGHYEEATDFQTKDAFQNNVINPFTKDLQTFGSVLTGGQGFLFVPTKTDSTENIHSNAQLYLEYNKKIKDLIAAHTAIVIGTKETVKYHPLDQNQDQQKLRESASGALVVQYDPDHHHRRMARIYFEYNFFKQLDFGPV